MRRAALRRLFALSGNVDDESARLAHAEQLAPWLGARIAAGTLAASKRSQALLVGAFLAEQARAATRQAMLAELDLGQPWAMLKGTALERTLYRPGERSMADLDLLVADLPAASQALVAAGAVQRQHRALLASLGLGHELTFEWQGQTIDVHDQVVSWPLFGVRTAELLASARDHLPAREDLFISLAVHAAQDGFVLSGRHLLDAVRLADDPGCDPERLAARAREFRAARVTAMFLALGLELGGHGARWQACLRQLDPAGVARARTVALPLEAPRARRAAELTARKQLLLAHEAPLRPLFYFAYRGLLRAGDRLLGRE